MLLIVQAETTHTGNMFLGQGRKQRSNIGDLIGDIMLSENAAPNNSGLLDPGNICNAVGKYCVPVVRLTISGKESNETLETDISSWASLSTYHAVPRGYGAIQRRQASGRSTARKPNTGTGLVRVYRQ